MFLIWPLCFLGFPFIKSFFEVRGKAGLSKRPGRQRSFRALASFVDLQTSSLSSLLSALQSLVGQEMVTGWMGVTTNAVIIRRDNRDSRCRHAPSPPLITHYPLRARSCPSLLSGHACDCLTKKYI